MTLLAITIKIIALLSYLTLAFLTVKSNTGSNVRRFFSIYLFGMIFWQFTSLMVNFSKDPETAMFWYNLLLAGFGLQSVLYFPFTRAFLNIEKQKTLTYISYFICVVVLIFGLSGLGNESVIIGKGGYYVPEYNPLLYPLIAIGYFFWAFGVYNLVNAFIKEPSALVKNRIKYPLVGAIVVMFGAASNMTSLQDYPIDITCNLINAMLIGYAVFRYKLLDIWVIFKRSLIYILTTVLLIGFYVLCVSVFEHYLAESIEYYSIWSGVISLLLLLFIFSIFFRRNAIQNFFASLFYRERLNYQNILENFSRKANTTLDLEMLINLLVSTMFETMKVNCAIFMLLDTGKKKYFIRGDQCIDNSKKDDFSIDENDPIVQWVKTYGSPLWREEMRIDPQYSQLLTEETFISSKRNISMIVPILHKEDLIGLLILGEKISGELYNEEDIKFLTTAANLTATAIANSLAYKEVERRLSEQTLLFVLSKTFGRSLKIETIVDSVLKILVYFLNLDYCAIIRFSGSESTASVFSQGFSPEVKNEIDRLNVRFIREHKHMQLNGSNILLDPGKIFSDREDLKENDREVLLSSLYAILEQDNEPLGLIVMSDWLGTNEGEERVDILRTIIAIITQGLMMHKTFSDLASMKSYNENIIDSINTMGDMLFVFGFDGNIRSVNRATSNRLGYSEKELIGNDIGVISQKKESFINILKKRRSIKNYETTFITRSGEPVSVLFSSSVIEASSGKTEEIVGIARDITDIKESEEKYRTLFEEVKDVIFSCDLKGRFLDINPAGVELLGFRSEEELLKIDMRKELFCDETAYDTFHKKLIKDGYITNCELCLKNRNGKEVNVIVTANVIGNGAGDIIAYRGILKDVTEQRALQQQLIQAQKMESIGTLAGGVAHDFNNIMCAILGYASIMKMNMKDDHPFYNYLDTIESSANRAAQLTNQLLAFARAGKPNVKVLNINMIVKETINLIKETFNRSIEIESELEDDILSIEGDANQIQQIIMNLCVNARDAMPGGGKLTIRTDAAEITTEYAESHLGAKEGDCVRLTVIDTGIGIDESIIRRIFDPFFTTKAPGEGTGLGLSVVYGVVKNHEGYIDARSEAGKGTIFEIFFPAFKGVRIEEEEVVVKPQTGNRELILVIDDEETVRNLAREILEKNGYRTLLASNGEEGVELYKTYREEIKLVIVDMIMPKLGGLETFQGLKATDKSVKALLSTGYNHSERVQEILDSGVRGFIKKPYNMNELLLQVRRTIDG